MTDFALAGSLIPGLELVEPLGPGPVGELWLVRHGESGLELGLEVVARRPSVEPEEAEAFRREVRAGVRLGHVNVVSSVGAGHAADGRYYLLTRHAPGSSLADVLAEHGTDPLPLPRALSMLSQIAAAVDHAHHAGVAHRDLRPLWVVVTQQKAGWDTVRVRGFGRVEALRAAGLTGRGWQEPILGAPAYASPEQLAGRDVDARTDVYSLGVLAFQLCTGRVPFECATPELFRAAHCNSAPPKPSEARPAFTGPLPPGLDALVLECLAKDPGDRPRPVELIRPFADAAREARDQAREQARKEGAPGQWRKIRAQAEATAKFVQYVRLGSDELARAAEALVRLDEQLGRRYEALEELAASYDETAAEMGQAATQLRRAAVDLCLEHGRLVDQGAGAQPGAADLVFQLGELYQSVAAADAETDEALRDVVAEMERVRRDARALLETEGALVRRLIDAVVARRSAAGDPSLRQRIDDLEALLAHAP